MRPTFATTTEVQPKFMFPSDPAAQWTALKGPAFLADANSYLIDVQYSLVVDVGASHAMRSRPGLLLEYLARL